METELAVEPQSLKKLSFKSVKRILDLFSPFHSQFPPPNPERDYILLMRSSGFSRGVPRYRRVASSGGTNCCLLMILFVRSATLCLFDPKIFTNLVLHQHYILPGLKAIIGNFNAFEPKSQMGTSGTPADCASLE
ncbi:hypothetical protein OROHE_006751 [Orobanche hederae]